MHEEEEHDDEDEGEAEDEPGDCCDAVAVHRGPCVVVVATATACEICALLRSVATDEVGEMETSM